MKKIFFGLLTSVFCAMSLGYAYTPIQEDYDLINTFISRTHNLTDTQLESLIDKTDYFLDRYNHHQRVVFILEHINTHAKQLLSSQGQFSIDALLNDFVNMYDGSVSLPELPIGEMDIFFDNPIVGFDRETSNIVTNICTQGYTTPIRSTLLVVVEGESYYKSIILPASPGLSTSWNNRTVCQQYNFPIKDFAIKSRRDHTVELIIDPYDYVPEYYEENNYIGTTLPLIGYVDTYPLGDLLVNAIDFDQSREAIRVSVQNNSNKDYNTVDLYVYDRYQTYVKSFNIRANTTKTLYFDDINIESFLSNSQHTITAIVDPFDKILESDDTNNSMTDVIRVGSRIDWYIEQASFTALTEMIDFTVCNKTSLDSQNRYLVDVIVDIAGQDTVTRTLTVPDYATFSDRCASSSVSLSSLGGYTNGNFRFSITVDPQNTYQESDETNNQNTQRVPLY